ncbi:M15 family metallopeptidase [Turicibacter sp. H121]|uniref:M15 family metallopeptidase n=1 Tax=Turicibacter sp. H121 TaxID=1712675 RepID=UPI0009EC9533|nr:M15 family metallopeptidase [Turicibacter sp. H121]MCU7199090.1 M15 family metallopeptidase [Turicibacter sp. H121]MDD5985900.1 M15 family metallopeptidase [Turicibacter sp.]
MQKVLVPIGIVTLLGSGLLFYSYMMSDEMVLRRLGYDKTLIESLIKEQPDLVQNLIEDDRNSEDISDYLTIKGFNYDCYNAYVQLAEYYPTLESSEVVYLATFLDHVFFPTLLQQGYEEETIKTWFSDPDFNTYVESVDIVALNRLLNYAKETESDLMTLFSYVNYEKQNPYLKLDEVISAIDEYQTVVLPNLKSKGYESQEVEALFYQFGLSDLKSLMETTLNPDQAFELMAASSFDSSCFAIYDEVLSQDENYSVTYALQYAKYPNVKSKFYQDIVETPNTNSLLVLVNQNYRLDEFYAPTDFVPVEVPVTPYSQVNTNYLRRDAADATELLFSKAQEAGYELTLRTGYISYSVQKNLYNQDVYEMGLEYADKFNSRPGHSEHQTGLAIDITTPSINNELSLEFADTEEGKWVLAHAHEYGFIIRYPENRESEVGYFYEPYHLRYVGVEVATEIFENNWTLEDYILNYGLLDAVSDEVQTPEEGTLEQDPSLEDSNEADDTDEEESNDHLDESDQEVLPDKSNASQSGSTDSELNEDSSTDDSSSDEDRQQAIQENRELSDQEKYQL